jgi:hypothetical protein
MADAKNDAAAVYDALRCDLIHLLMEHRSQGRLRGRPKAPTRNDHSSLSI